MSKNNNKMIIYVLVVLVVVVFLVFITIKGKNTSVPQTELGSQTQPQSQTQSEQVGAEQNTNMDNSQDGVKITTLKEGTGVVAKSGDTVAMNYTGMLADGTVFDSNIDPKFKHVQPFVFTIGAGQVIPGWDIGVAGMKVGEQRKLEIKPEYAYGATGAGGVIPPNATLTFNVELMGIK